MKILFTGASSFTGMWFATELSKAGHYVAAAFLRPLADYNGLRGDRVEKVLGCCRAVFDCPFGSEPFLELLQNEKWDILCHHAADVTNYKSVDFDFSAALSANTKNIKKVGELLKNNGCTKILLTGSVFEQNEGQGSDNWRAVSPYGLSKGLTADVYKYFCAQYGIGLGKFVIPNPFGPYEEPRFTHYLMNSWYAGSKPTVVSPDYCRDNIHVSLLAKAYVYFLDNLPAAPGYTKFNPIGYQESQGNFTKRFAEEMEKRLPIRCPFEIGVQTDFSEPVVRFNTDSLDHRMLEWDEKKAWDELANYYMNRYGK